jgi:serine/threonine protein kinase
MLHRMRSLRGRSLTTKYDIDWKTVLGEGAYGTVHPARLAATGEKVALKKISKHYTSGHGFKAETDALLRIYDNGGHPNISGLRDMYEDHNYYYLILDLVTGGEMFEHLIHYGAYSEADAARLMHEVASALAFLHGVGVVHADLKPENLLLSTKNRLDGTIKMIDFGCAVVADDEVLGTTRKKAKSSKKAASSTGTTAYWAPERFENSSEPTAAMDMWSVGLILYIMLTGKAIERKQSRRDIIHILLTEPFQVSIRLTSRVCPPTNRLKHTSRPIHDLRSIWIWSDTCLTVPLT